MRVNQNVMLTLKVPNTTNAAFANTIDPDDFVWVAALRPSQHFFSHVGTEDPDKTAHDEPSYLDLQCLPSSLLFFNTAKSLLKVLF